MPYETLKVMRENGLRVLLVGYECGNQQILHNIKKGMRIDVARRFTEDCHRLGIAIHGTFVIGLPGETRETIEETIRFAREINPHTIQVSLAAAYPGTFLYDQAAARAAGWCKIGGRLVQGRASRSRRSPTRISARTKSSRRWPTFYSGSISGRARWPNSRSTCCRAGT